MQGLIIETKILFFPTLNKYVILLALGKSTNQNERCFESWMGIIFHEATRGQSLQEVPEVESRP